MKLYDIQKNWNKIKPIIETDECKQIWFRDLVISCKRRAIEHNYEHHERNYEDYERPMEFDTGDWRFWVQGRPPRYLEYVVQGRCHWVVNMNLYVAMRLMPEKPWRIVAGEDHSTVWYGEDMVFDINYFITGPDISGWWDKLFNDPDTHILKPSEYLKLYV